MRIGIDCRFWNESGVGRYIRNIVGQLAELDYQNDYFVFLLDSDFRSVSLPSNFKKIKANIHWHSLSEQLILPRIFLKEHLDLLFAPHFNVPIFYPGKFIVTIHDLTPLRVRTGRVTTLPYPVYLMKYIGAALVYLSAVTRSVKIFTPSNFVKSDLEKTFKVKSEKIVITPCTVDESFYRRSGQEVGEILNKYHVKKPYLFYVGNAYPHKNLERLVKAFEFVVKDYPGLSLVLGGRKDFFYKRLESESMSLSYSSQIIFPGFIDDKDLPALYSGAEAFVYPSLYEGFGIQVLEAFGCGCKVVCSNTTSLPEVGGNLAIYLNPRDVNDISKKIIECLNTEPHDFINLASKAANRFSWKSSAQVVFEVIENI